jgi:acetylornithine deacetylase/succinyl-diaminopimelate desuccinylase-like protein
MLAATALPGLQAKRPAIDVSGSERFDVAGVGAYGGTHDAVYRHIDAHLDEHVSHLQRWIRQPSVSAQNKGIAEMAALVRDDFRALGFAEAELVPTAGHPGVWGYYDAGAPKTLLVYMMYDVQPVEEKDWQSPPFEARLVENALGTVLVGRGAVNQKGPERAFLNAVGSIIATEGRLPVNLMVAAEGEEEQGSVNFPQIVTAREARMRTAVGALFPGCAQEPDGRASMDLGVKGILYMQLECRGGARGGPSRHEVHGSAKAFLDSPTWRLVQALASLTSPDGNTIAVPGYYDDIRPPNAEERMLFNNSLAEFDEAQVRQALGASRWVDGLDARAALAELLFDTTMNIDGIWSGYTGEGTKTILPHVAYAKVDSRLVPNQTPQRALELIRRHLDAHGFDDVVVTRWDGYPPAQTSVRSALVERGIAVMNKYGHAPSVSPRLAGSAPYYQFTDRLKLPMLPFGLGHGDGAHAPNEYIVIEPAAGSRVAGLAEIEKSWVDLLHALAEA